MARIHPILVVSRDLRTQDAYVLFLRRRRLPALSVTTCADAVAVCRQVRVSAIVVDVATPEDWVGCRLMGRLCGSAVIAVTASQRRPGADDEATARDNGCAAVVSRAGGFPAVARALSVVFEQRFA